MHRMLRAIHPHLNRKGVAGLVEFLDSTDFGFFTKFMLAFDRRFIGVTQLARDWVGIESRLAEVSVPFVARDFSDYLGMDLFINRLPPAFSQEHQPAILMGINHESIIEPVFLVSVLDRPDVRFLGMKVFQYLGPYVKELILPVLPSRIATDYQGDLRTRMGTALKPIYQVYKLDKRSSKEIKELNQQSISQAIEHIRSGGILELYPTGGRSIEKGWYPGIGRILSELPADVLSSTAIFPVKTVGLTRNFVYRSMRRAAFGRQQRHAVYMNIFDTIYIPADLAGADPGLILHYLQTETAKRLKASDNVLNKAGMKKFPFDDEYPNPAANTTPAGN